MKKHTNSDVSFVVGTSGNNGAAVGTVSSSSSIIELRKERKNFHNKSLIEVTKLPSMQPRLRDGCFVYFKMDRLEINNLSI